MTNKTEYTFFSRLFRRITTQETVNIIIVKRSVTTETRYDIVYRYTVAVAPGSTMLNASTNGRDADFPGSRGRWVSGT